MTSADDYAALAEVYDDWQERYGAFWRLVLPRLEGVLARFAGHPLSFTDLGCGTGELLRALGRAHPHWSLCGVERSAAMLDVARAKPGAARIRWVQGSFEQPSARGEATAAGCFFDALNHAAGPGALERTVAAVHETLVPDGLFIFDLNNEVGFSSWWRGRRVYPGPGWTLTMEAQFSRHQGLAHGRALVEWPERRDETAVIERCFTDTEVRQVLETTGFAVERAEPWQPMPNDVPGKTWWVARKR